MKFLKKHKRSGGVIVSMLLLLCLIPMGCGGSSDAEPVSPPKTSYELEDMIKEVKDSNKVRDQDIADLRADIKDIDTKDYDKEIADILDKLAELEAMLATPTPNPNGSQPTPTAQPSNNPQPSSGITATLEPSGKFMAELYAELVIRNNSGDDVINPTVKMKFNTNSLLSIDTLEDYVWCQFNGENGTKNVYSSSEGSIVFYSYTLEGFYIPTGGKGTANIHFYPSLVVDGLEGVFWTPSVSVE